MRKLIIGLTVTKTKCDNENNTSAQTKLLTQQLVSENRSHCDLGLPGDIF